MVLVSGLWWPPCTCPIQDLVLLVPARAVGGHGGRSLLLKPGLQVPPCIY